MPRAAKLLLAIAVTTAVAYGFTRTQIWEDIRTAMSEREAQLRVALGLEEQ